MEFFVESPKRATEEEKRRRLRNVADTLSSYDHALAEQVLPSVALHNKNIQPDPVDKAASRIQSKWRGLLAKVEFEKRLWEQYEKEQAQLQRHRNMQIKQGLAMIESQRWQQQMDDDRYLEKHREYKKVYAAQLLQRAVRKHWLAIIPKK